MVTSAYAKQNILIPFHITHLYIPYNSNLSHCYFGEAWSWPNSQDVRIKPDATTLARGCIHKNQPPPQQLSSGAGAILCSHATFPTFQYNVTCEMRFEKCSSNRKHTLCVLMCKILPSSKMPLHSCSLDCVWWICDTLESCVDGIGTWQARYIPSLSFLMQRLVMPWDRQPLKNWGGGKWENVIRLSPEVKVARQAASQVYSLPPI